MTKPQPKITKKTLKESRESLVDKAMFDLDFAVLTAMAAVICSFGFKMNSPSVIVGAMVISPLLYAVVSVGVASFCKDVKLLFRGVLTLFFGLAIAIAVAAAVSLFFSIEYKSEIFERLTSTPSDYFFVALFSGLAGTFAYFWPKIIEAISGIAISVALIPPVVMLGFGIANLDFSLVASSSTIVLMNVLGIYLGSFLMFAILSFISE